MPPKQTLRNFISVLLLSTMLVACADDGKELRPATQSTVPLTTTSITSTTYVTTSAPTGFTLASQWTNGGTLPSRYTCDGDGLSPSLAWFNVPENSTNLALVVVDESLTTPSGDDYLLWVVSGIPVEATGLSEGAIPAGAVEGLNSAGGVGWVAPCPSAGPAHRLLFSLYALSGDTGISSGMSGQEMRSIIVDASIDETSVFATYAAPAEAG